jgi:protein-L-isoaspartate(D-aspartate) O-methyltransferase
MRRAGKASFLLAAALFLFSAGTNVIAQNEDPYAEDRKRMVDLQVRKRGVTDEKVLTVMEKVPRHLFVPQTIASMAYDDTPLPIGSGQTISQPYIVGYMTDAAGLGPEDRVLEVGTGSGYQAAVLAELVKEVYSIEIIEVLAAAAKDRLERMGYDNIEVIWGDGYKGWPEKAPFDAIIITAAPDKVPEELIRQLKTGGRMVVPVGSFFQELKLIIKTDKGYEERSLLPVRFVPMVHGEE